MQKFVLAVIVVIVLGACLPFSQIANSTPIVDVAGTSAANVRTAVIQTLTAQPTITSAPATETSAGLFATPLPPVTDTPTSVPPTVNTTVSAITATFVVATSTGISATVPSGSATLTPTLGVLTYGTLPPAVPFSRITLVNRSRRQAYISLQVVTAEGGPTIIEYPVRRQVDLKAPIGHYLYVAWVGGREMVGEFSLHKDQDLEIILYSDKIVVK